MDAGSGPVSAWLLEYPADDPIPFSISSSSTAKEKRTYTSKPFLQAMEEVLHYGMYDLSRLEQMILSHVAGDFFNIQEDSYP